MHVLQWSQYCSHVKIQLVLLSPTMMFRDVDLHTALVHSMSSQFSTFSYRRYVATAPADGLPSRQCPSRWLCAVCNSLRFRMLDLMNKAGPLQELCRWQSVKVLCSVVNIYFTECLPEHMDVLTALHPAAQTQQLMTARLPQCLIRPQGLLKKHASNGSGGRAQGDLTGRSQDMGCGCVVAYQTKMP